MRPSSGTPISITATASDPNGSVTSVRFFNGTNLLGTGVISTGGTNFALAWTNAPLGTNLLTAVVTDNSGLNNTSAPPVPVIVFQSVSASITPVNPALCAGATVTFLCQCLRSTGPFGYAWE